MQRPWALLALMVWPGIGGDALALGISPKDPHYFQHDGQTVVLVGCSDRSALFIWESDKGFHWREYLRDIAGAGLNYVRQDVCAWSDLDTPAGYPGQFSSPAWPFLRPGPGTAADGLPRFDLTRPDPAFFADRLRPFLDEAARLGIFVELTLFDQTNARNFGANLFSDENNVNDLGVGPRDVFGPSATANARLWEAQRAYIGSVVEATQDYDHIIYEVANETGSAEWVAAVVDLVHELRPGALVSAGEQSSNYDVHAGKNDIVIKHRGTGGWYDSDEDVKRHHDSLLDFRVGKPVIHNEFFLYANRSTDDPNFVRKMMWGDVVAGGHVNFYDFRFWRGTGRTAQEGDPSQAPPDEILRAGGILLEFLKRHSIDLAGLQPDDSLVRSDEGIAFAMGGEPGLLAYALGASRVELQTDARRAIALHTATGGEGTVDLRALGGGWREGALPAGWTEAAVWAPAP
ncbi:MAG: hypothetical protein ACE5R4_13420 [Armatimonadota bacterium]